LKPSSGLFKISSPARQGADKKVQVAQKSNSRAAGLKKGRQKKAKMEKFAGGEKKELAGNEHALNIGLHAQNVTIND